MIIISNQEAKSLAGLLKEASQVISKLNFEVERNNPPLVIETRLDRVAERLKARTEPLDASSM